MSADSLRLRLAKMYAGLHDLLDGIKKTRAEVKKYKEQLNEWKAAESGIVVKERNEQLRSTKKIEEEIKKAFKEQEVENHKLKQQINDLVFEKMRAQQMFMNVEKEKKELEFLIGLEKEDVNQLEKDG